MWTIRRKDRIAIVLSLAWLALSVYLTSFEYRPEEFFIFGMTPLAFYWAWRWIKAAKE